MACNRIWRSQDPSGEAMESNLEAMASNLIAMASHLATSHGLADLAMASDLLAMPFNRTWRCQGPLR